MDNYESIAQIPECNVVRGTCKRSKSRSSGLFIFYCKEEMWIFFPLQDFCTQFINCCYQWWDAALFHCVFTSTASFGLFLQHWYYPECSAYFGVSNHGEVSVEWSWLGAHLLQTWPTDPGHSPHSQHHSPNLNCPHCRHRHPPPLRCLFQREDFQFRDEDDQCSEITGQGQISTNNSTVSDDKRL